jgi:hypothetical protein
MAKKLQASLNGGEISPSLYGRVDVEAFRNSLALCRNWFVRATGGASNRAGTQFLYALSADSEAALIPFIFSQDQSYMLVLQNENVRVFADGEFLQDSSVATIIDVSQITPVPNSFIVFETAAPHGFSIGQTVTIAGVVSATGDLMVNGAWVIAFVSATTFNVEGSLGAGTYGSGGTATVAYELSTPYQSDELASIRYTQSADVLTLVHQGYMPHEVVRTGAAVFGVSEIDDFEGGPFLDDNVSATTVTASAASGTGITLTASASIFTADHVGALFRITIQDLSAIPPWEPSKHIAATGVDPDGLYRRSNGKVYIAAGNSTAPASGTYTGTVPPSHDEGIQSDGDGGLYNGTASTRAGVSWQYVHSMFGIARITAAAGTTATADVLETLPIVSPATSTVWAFGAWSEDQGYPALCTYYQDRLVFANTPGQPQTEWASKTGDYHNFGTSSPTVASDAIRQTLNARQINAILEMVPMDQLVSLTASSSWASPKRKEAWTPTTIGYDPQSFDGAAFIRSILTGDSALFVQNGATKIRELSFQDGGDKFRGDELTILARHLFEDGNTIVDMDYAKEPHGILWIVRSDGALIGLTYLKEQQVVGWHRHETDGYFERVCVIPENGVDTPYFVVRREIGGETVRYLERLAVRDQADILDSFFVDCGLSYDGRNTTGTTITISGASFDGGDDVTLTASVAIFQSSDVGSDAIQFPHADGNVRALITGFTSSTVVTAQLQSPVPAALQAVATTTWTFARDTFGGLGHLEGETVAILADGSPEVPQVVANGRVSLAYPAGVVHIGLPYVADIETLNIMVTESGDPIVENAKVVPKVHAMVEKTLGLKAGPDDDSLFELGLQPSDFDYNAPWDTQSEVQTAHIPTNWEQRGKVLFRQDRPLPATILAIVPDYQVGGSGGNG